MFNFNMFNKLGFQVNPILDLDRKRKTERGRIKIKSILKVNNHVIIVSSYFVTEEELSFICDISIFIL